LPAPTPATPWTPTATSTPGATTATALWASPIGAPAMDSGPWTTSTPIPER